MDRLIVEIVECKDLIKFKGREPDPYCKLSCDDVVCVTKTVTESANPVWKEKFEFNQDSLELSLQVICNKQDKILGYLSIRLYEHRHVPVNIAHNHRYRLKIDDPELKKSFKSSICIKISSSRRLETNQKPSSVQEGEDISNLAVQMQMLSEESSESSSRSLSATESIIEIGDSIITALHRQGKKLDGSYAKSQQIEADLDQSRKELRSIHSARGQLANYLFHDSHGEIDPEYYGIDGNTFTSTSVAQNHESDTVDQRIDKISDNLEKIRSQAEKIRDELVLQNELIDELSSNVNSSNVKMKKVRRKIQREF